MMTTAGLYRVACDEAGRGSWAGPLIVGAVAVPVDYEVLPPEGLTDSKKLTPRRRMFLIPGILDWVSYAGTGHATPHEIDTLGVTVASRLAAHRALSKLRLPLEEVDHILLDGNIDYITGTVQGKKSPEPLPEVRTLVKADLTDPACSAASILAKVHHDEVITVLSGAYPEYNWLKGMGYPTAAHAEAVREHGLSNQHRKSWKMPQSRAVQDSD